MKEKSILWEEESTPTEWNNETYWRTEVRRELGSYNKDDNNNNNDGDGDAKVTGNGNVMGDGRATEMTEITRPHRNIENGHVNIENGHVNRGFLTD